MKHKAAILAVLGVCFLCIGVVYAGNVLDTDLKDGKSIVETRKLVMHNLKHSFEEIGNKFEAGRIKALKTNAVSMAVSGRIMPPLYKDRHESAYDGKGSFYKGASAADFEAASQELLKYAEMLEKSADSGQPAGVMKAVGGLQGSCKGCHMKYRGKF